MLEINQMEARKLGAYRLNLMALVGGTAMFSSWIIVLSFSMTKVSSANIVSSFIKKHNLLQN